jgi:hypothetical protein
MDIVRRAVGGEEDAVEQEQLSLLYVSSLQPTGERHASVRKFWSFTCLPLEVKRIWSCGRMDVALERYVRRSSKVVGIESGTMHSPEGTMNIWSDMWCT